MITKLNWWDCTTVFVISHSKLQDFGQKWGDGDWPRSSLPNALTACLVQLQNLDKRQRQKMNYFCHNKTWQMHLNQSDAIKQTQLHCTTQRKAHSLTIQVCHHFCWPFFLPKNCSSHDQSNIWQNISDKITFRTFCWQAWHWDQALSMWQWPICWQGFHQWMRVNRTTNHLLWC